MTKKASQQLHFKRRALERLGVTVSREQIDGIMADIRRSKGFLQRQSGTRTHWRTERLGPPCVVVYDKSRGTLVTVLTLDLYNKGAAVCE